MKIEIFYMRINYKKMLIEINFKQITFTTLLLSIISMYSTTNAKPVDDAILRSNQVALDANLRSPPSKITFDVPAANPGSKHRRFPSIQSVTVPREPREGDVDLERGPDNLPLPGQIVRANTALNPKTHPGWRTEALAWQNEFLSTVQFLLVSFGGIHAANSNLENALAFGISLAIAVQLWGGQFMNPMLSMCHALIGEISPFRAVSMLTAELTGAIAASALIKALTGSIPGVVSLNGVNVTQGLFIESIISAVLAYLILLISHEKHPVSYNTPFTVGTALTALELWSIPYTAGSANFARYLGPAVISGTFHKYDWIYFVSNVIGGVSATAYYKFVRAVQDEPTIEPIFGPSLAKQTRDRVTEIQE